MIRLKIAGFFKGGVLGAAYVIAVLKVDKLGIESPIELLIDTGATRTISDNVRFRLLRLCPIINYDSFNTIIFIFFFKETRNMLPKE